MAMSLSPYFTIFLLTLTLCVCTKLKPVNQEGNGDNNINVTSFSVFHTEATVIIWEILEVLKEV